MKRLYAALIILAILIPIFPIQSSNSSLPSDMASSVFFLSAPGKYKFPYNNIFSFKDISLLFMNDSLPSMHKPVSVKKEVPLIETPLNAFTATSSVSTNVLPENIIETEILKGRTSCFGVEINNATDYVLDTSLKDVAVSSTPTVLIVHTHTSESYRPSESFPYTPTDNSRTEDTNFNVARVGAELASSLSSYGINVIHDSSLNDYPSYNGSYSKALSLIETHLQQNPSIDIVIDLHRDAMERSDGTKLSTVCNIGNEKAAQVMLVVGTDQSGLMHENWRDNFSFAVKLQTIINENFPHLARPINVRKERFNGHVSKKELIIEIGTTGNTLDEALVSARALAYAINEFYTG